MSPNRLSVESAGGPFGSSGTSAFGGEEDLPINIEKSPLTIAAIKPNRTAKIRASLPVPFFPPRSKLSTETELAF